MNGPEKKMVFLSFVLFVMGIVYRFLPWGLPSIDTFQVGDPVVIANVEDSTHRELRGDPVEKTVFVADKIKDNSQKMSKKKPPKVQFPIPINSADLDMLCALKGVGPKLAEKIIAQRESSGPFKSEKDLKKVPGIGKKKLETILQGVIFD
ncbi:MULTISPECIES: helix-hairpin-helix domain-containing protein [unclassified Fibrobacter]|uniref:ComEA family DNA-binding protein n=1 Tax=unclassified Fibrobacter TaxID=2634177 RepID=UPI00091A7ABA|nr:MULTISPECIES: helix-hairpin-helix domain-containing protein [unclassified Fibrobacter]MDO4946916.1 helix-hairpin-helix domain-containing protein [Fibrobacter sp.]OWV13062.1 hypothetical protein B7992_08440 [Fibrobacter sp. UWH1]SHL21533.1 competence protein ComEA [Fibrobacter sp. UWH6]